MKIHSGMSADKILEMFGEPNNIRQEMCGVKLGKPWLCTTWEYVSWGFASFTFSGEPGAYILNNFTINR